MCRWKLFTMNDYDQPGNCVTLDFNLFDRFLTTVVDWRHSWLSLILRWPSTSLPWPSFPSNRKLGANVCSERYFKNVVLFIILTFGDIITDEALIDGEEGGKPPAPQRSGFENGSTLTFEGGMCSLSIYLHPHHKAFQYIISFMSYRAPWEDFKPIFGFWKMAKILVLKCKTPKREGILKLFMVRMKIYR